MVCMLWNSKHFSYLPFLALALGIEHLLTVWLICLVNFVLPLQQCIWTQFTLSYILSGKVNICLAFS